MREKEGLINLVELPSIEDDCLLVFTQFPENLPFVPRRVYWIVKPAEGLPRGAHAHWKNSQVLFCLQGKVKMVLDDGRRREEVELDRPNVGILLPPMIWHEMLEMDEETILLVLASEKYDPSDYVRDYQEFLELEKND